MVEHQVVVLNMLVVLGRTLAEYPNQDQLHPSLTVSTQTNNPKQTFEFDFRLTLTLYCPSEETGAKMSGQFQ